MRNWSRSLALLLAFCFASPILRAAEPPDDGLFQPMDVFQLEYASDPQISPDGRQIVYVRNFMDIMRDRRRSNLWLLNVDGSGRTRLTDTPEGDAPQTPIWSPDGSKIATSMSDEGIAFIIDANRTFEDQTVDLLPEVPGGNGEFQPSDWSPDGRWLVGAVGPAPGTTDSGTIWRLDLETREYELLADGTAAAWMADGRRVLFRIAYPPGFYVVDTVSRSRVPVDVPPAVTMVLSSNNLRAYLAQVEEESDIWMLEMEGR